MTILSLAHLSMMPNRIERLDPMIRAVRPKECSCWRGAPRRSLLLQAELGHPPRLGQMSDPNTS